MAESTHPAGSSGDHPPEFVLTPEQQDLRNAVRQFCTDLFDEATVRRLVETEAGHDPGLWARLGAELGVLGLAVPEERGGAGGGLVDQAIVAEEFGAALVPGPLLGTVGLAIPALLAADGAAGDDELLPALVAGERTAALAVPADALAIGEVTVTVDGGRLTGEVAQVVDGAADVLLVPARSGDVIGLYATDGGERTPLSTLDSTRRQARVRFDATPARLLAAGAEADAALSAALRVGGALLAAEQVGGAQRLLDLTVSYAGTRLQFGRPIGSFQAVKHRCADMLVQVEHARSTAQHAAWALQDGTDDADLAVSIAQATCSQAYQQIAGDAVQLHGGIGFTWEHPAHLYFKRAYSDAALLGGAAAHRDRIAAQVLDKAEAVGSPAVATGRP